MSKTFLKIKIKSLAAEARIIRDEEKKWPGPSDVRFGLHAHRVNEVRTEARVAQLAYGLIRGRSYAQLEGAGTDPYTPPNWVRVALLATRYGKKKISVDDVHAWVKAAHSLSVPATAGMAVAA